MGWALEKISDGTENGRNGAGFWLLCQLRDNGHSFAEAIAYGPHYVQLVAELGNHAYTLQEYVDSARSAYSRSAREPLATSGTEIADTGIDEEPVAESVPGTVAAVPVHGVGVVGSAAGDDEEEDDEEGDAEAEENDDAEDDDGGDCDFHEHNEGTLLNEPKPANAAKLAAARATLKSNFKLDVACVVKYGEGDGAYELLLADGRRVDLGRTNRFSSERAFRNSVIAGLNLQPPPLKKGRWRKCLDAMLVLLEIRPGFTEEEMVVEWVEGFLHNHGLEIPSLKEATGDVARVFDAINGKINDFNDCGAIVETVKDGHVVIKLRSLYRFLTLHWNVKLSQPDLSVLLGKVGLRRVATLNGPMWQGERLRTQRVWVAPAARFHFVPRSEQVRIFCSDDSRYCTPEKADVVQQAQQVQ
jgi:hypothetical protein